MCSFARCIDADSMIANNHDIMFLGLYTFRGGTRMIDKISQEDLKNHLRLHLFTALAALIDAAFLVFWVVMQWFVSHILDGIHLSGIDVLTKGAFLVMFAVSTLTPILVYMYRDIRIVIIRSNHAIQQELEMSSNSNV